MASIEGDEDRKPGAHVAHSHPQGRPLRREVVASLTRSAVLIVVACCVYGLAPLDRRPDPAAAAQLTGWLLVFIAVVVWQLRAVMGSNHPGLRASEAVAVCVPLLILPFASAYFVNSQIDPTSFSEPLSRLDALYFAVTTFATVGFGDIAPRSDAARMLVTAQMLADLLLLGFIAKVLFGVVQHRREALGIGSTPPTAN